MAYREVSRVEIAEVVRRWQSGMSQRQIATGTGLSRATIRRYIVAAMGAGLTRDGAAPSEEQLTRLAGVSVAGPRKVEIPTEEVLAPWADQVYEWLTADRLQVTRIQELLAGRGCRVSYTSLRRFIVRRGWQRRSPATVRMRESAPGEVAEMDFGRLGLMQDPETGRRRVVWALIIVLSYSRHSFVWPTFSQKLVDVIEGLEAAWTFFEGVPNYLVIDNFPAAVAGVDPLHPRLTRGFLEYSQHRGFILDPARVRHPRDKPRVERGVPYVRERFFKGGEFTGLSDMRSAARRWCLEVAGQRVHGTTRKQPLAVFRHDDPHRRVLGQPFSVVGILVARQTTVHRLPEKAHQSVLHVTTAPALLQTLIRRLRQSQCIVQLAAGQQPSVRGDGSAAKLQPYTSVETERGAEVGAFTH